MKYLLPCPCGKSVPVEISQAGQTARCGCGNTLNVPAMRLIRQLPVADAAAPSKFRNERSWSVLQGVLFASGLTLLGIGLAMAAYYQWGRSSLDTQERPWDNVAEDHKSIDAWSIDQTWEAWKNVRGESIGPYTPPAFVAYRFISAYWLRNVFKGLMVAGVGSLLLVSAFLAGFLTKPRARRTGHPAPPKR
ncbi:MAG: hypothetical protein ACYC3X_06590 [Pirellulaceae bacterium]